MNSTTQGDRIPARPFTVTAGLVFIFLNGMVWLAFGLIIAFDAHPALPEAPAIKVIMAALSIIAAGILFTLYFLLNRRKPIAFYITLLFFAVTSILTVTDQVGPADMAILLINFIPILLLLKDRLWYLHSNQRPM